MFLYELFPVSVLKGNNSGKTYIILESKSEMCKWFMVHCFWWIYFQLELTNITLLSVNIGPRTYLHNLWKYLTNMNKRISIARSSVILILPLLVLKKRCFWNDYYIFYYTTTITLISNAVHRLQMDQFLKRWEI